MNFQDDNLIIFKNTYYKKLKKKKITDQNSFLSSLIKNENLCFIALSFNFLLLNSSSNLNNTSFFFKKSLWSSLNNILVNELFPKITSISGFHFLTGCVEMHRGKGSMQGVPHIHMGVVFLNKNLSFEYISQLKYIIAQLPLDVHINEKIHFTEIFNYLNYLYKEESALDLRQTCLNFKVSQFFFVSNYFKDNKSLFPVYGVFLLLSKLLSSNIQFIYSNIDNLYCPKKLDDFSFVISLIKQYFSFFNYKLDKTREWVMYKDVNSSPFLWKKYYKIDFLLQNLKAYFSYAERELNLYFFKAFDLLFKSKDLPILNIPYRYLLFKDCIFDITDGEILFFFNRLPLPNLPQYKDLFDTDRFIDFDLCLKNKTGFIYEKICKYSKKFSEVYYFDNLFNKTFFDQFKSYKSFELINFYQALAKLIYPNFKNKQSNLFIYGPSDTGKSSLIDNLLNLVYFENEIGLVDIYKNQFQFEGLIGAKVGVFNEFKDTNFNINTLKKISDGSALSIPQKHKKALKIKLNLPLVFLSNIALKNHSLLDQAFLNRLSFYAKLSKILTKQDRTLLLSNLPYFLIILRISLFYEIYKLKEYRSCNICFSLMYEITYYLGYNMNYIGSYKVPGSVHELKKRFDVEILYEKEGFMEGGKDNCWDEDYTYWNDN